MTKLTLSIIGLTSCAFAAQVSAVTILTPIDAVTVTDDGDATSVGSVNIAGTALDGGGDYIIRERRSTGQSDRQISSFFLFDVSSLTLADVNDPGFQASFQIDYISQLNNIVPNNSAPAVVGRVVSGDGWSGDPVDNDLPLHDWGFDEDTTTVIAQNVQTLIVDIPALAPPVNDLSVDVTDIVKGWVDGSFDNFGLVLFIDELEAQGAGFSNPELVYAVPEPGSLALLGLGGLLIARRRRAA